jgi:hypothetical protein
MQSFVVDGHHHNPHVGFPIDYIFLVVLDGFDYYVFYLFSENFHFVYTWPAVMTFIQVIPIVLINSDREHSFKAFINVIFYDALVHQLVYIKGGSMSKIKNQGMSQWFWMAVV